MLKIGLSQLPLQVELEQNMALVVEVLAQAAREGCRVVVFPEGMLWWPPDRPPAKRDIDAAVQAVCAAAARANLYAILPTMDQRYDGDKPFNKLYVIDPSGRIVQQYHKLWYDDRSNEVPGPFDLDGTPCSTILCADRWIRGVEELPAFAGSRILFECSCNFSNEWIPELGYYWYVPRAMRNGAWVVFCNSPDGCPAFEPPGPIGHGHSAVIAPDGRIVAAAGEGPQALLTAKIDLEEATLAPARERAGHPLFRRFWEIGQRIMSGNLADVTSEETSGSSERLASPNETVTLAAAQMVCSRDLAANLDRMEQLAVVARSRGADVVIFPELAVTGALEEDIRRADRRTLKRALARLRGVAREAGCYLVFGMPRLEGSRRWNSAWVLSPAGEVETCHDQLVIERPELFEAGSSAQSLWFRLKGVPTVVTVGREALWSEIAELAAMRGAQIHLHIAYDRDTSRAGCLQRKQIWANLASYRTLTATVNAASSSGLDKPSADAAGGSILWQDYSRGSNRNRDGTGYQPYCAVSLAEAGVAQEILYATQTVQAENRQFEIVTGTTNPQMAPWFREGIRLMGGGSSTSITSMKG